MNPQSRVQANGKAAVARLSAKAPAHTALVLKKSRGVFVVVELIRVVPEDLHLSASVVDVHADTMRARHAAADSQIEGAQLGVPSAAAGALQGAVTKWQKESSIVYGRLVGHSTGLREVAAAYLRTDETGGQGLAAAGNAMPSIDLGL